jgi:peptidoglycan-N-acetylmuramic acid deacetylase
VDKRRLIIFVIVIFAIIGCAIVGKLLITENYTETLTANSTLSNKKICWGIKRADNNEQPDVGEENKKILEANNGICMGNSEKKNIYLTFDEGYEAGYTSQILDILKENEVTATFFITGHYLNTQTDLVQRMLEEGHEVGNHTVNHPSMPEISEEQLKTEVMDLHQAVYEKFAYEMKYIRPPKGEFSERTISLTESMGYKTVMWSFAYSDWDENNQPSVENAKNKILSNVHNGEIMLLHANSKTNASILGDIIKEIKSMGYEFKSLDSFE